jgi:fatty acid desaturase
MPDDRTLAHEEYAALRATIRERGTIRIVLLLATMAAWAALVVAMAATVALPILSLVPLVVLFTGFEGLYALYTGVERVGRYLQVYYEPSGPAELPGWERVAMDYASRYPGAAIDPLFTTVFLLATVANFLPVALGGAPVELLVIGTAHAAFAWRVVRARRRAALERALDLERLSALRRTPGSAA